MGTQPGAAPGDASPGQGGGRGADPVPSRSLLVFCRFLRTLGGVAGGVRVGASARELALIDDQIFGADRLLGEIVLQNFAHARGVARLGRERAPRDMRGHAVMGHGAPGMVARRRLRESYVAGVTGELPAFERTHAGVTTDHLAPAVFTR